MNFDNKNTYQCIQLLVPALNNICHSMASFLKRKSPSKEAHLLAADFFAITFILHVFKLQVPLLFESVMKLCSIIDVLYFVIASNVVCRGFLWL